MKTLAEQLKEVLDNTPKEQLEKEWDDIEKMGFEGPTMEEFLKNTIMNKHEIIKLGKSYSFDLDSDEDNILTFSTRENGDMMRDEPGEEDIKSAEIVCDLIKKKYGIEAVLELVDEWVMIDVPLS